MQFLKFLNFLSKIVHYDIFVSNFHMKYVREASEWRKKEFWKEHQNKDGDSGDRREIVDFDGFQIRCKGDREDRDRKRSEPKIK